MYIYYSWVSAYLLATQQNAKRIPTLAKNFFAFYKSQWPKS